MENKKLNYMKVSAPDQEKLAELTLAAIGARTKQQFAMLCGVQPSTISRLINKSNKGASTEDLIYAIAKNAAPDSGVTLEALMEANGMAPAPDQIRGGSLKRMYAYYERINGMTMKHFEAAVQGVVFDEMLSRGAEVRVGNIRYEVSKSLTIHPDILIMTDVIDGENSVWFFEVLMPYLPRYADSKTGTLDSRKKVNIKQQVFQKISRFSFVSMNKVELFRPKRFSIVTAEKEIYDLLIDEFSEMRVPTGITFILIDMDSSRIIDEFGLTDAEGNMVECYFKEKSRADAEEYSDIEDEELDIEEEDLDD